MKNINSYFQSTHNSSLGLSFPGPLSCIQNSNQTGFIYQPTNYVEHLYKSRTLVGIWLWIHWVSYNCSSTVCVTNYRLSLISILGITRPSYIVGLTCTRLGGKIVNVVIPAIVSNNTALIITVYETYHRGSYYCSTAVNVTGSERNHVKTIIWACHINLLYFSSNSVIKKVFYEGSGRDAVKNVAKNEFFKDADVIYSSYKSLINIRIFHDGNY